MSLAIPEPAQLVAVDDTCQAIEAWAADCDDIEQLREANVRLAAIDEYLERTSIEGRARVSAAMRRLEVRIGQLLGPASPNGNYSPGSLTRDPGDPLPLDRNERHRFRQMAEHPEVVEDVIEASTDEAPASRNKVLDGIRRKKESTLDRLQRLSHKERADQIRPLAEAGNTSKQIAGHLGLSEERVRDIARRHEIVLVDAVLGRPRRLDSDRIVRTTVHDLEGAVIGLSLVDFDDLDLDQIEGWTASLSHSLRQLNRFNKRLKETIQ